MQVITFESVVWLLVTLGPLIFLQRNLHYQIQAVLFSLTQRADISMVVFSLLFFPGVVLHELSHYVMARLMFVKTGRISLIPQQSNEGQLRLGYVEATVCDPVRDTIIGSAPLIAGGIFVAYAGLYRLNLLTLIEITSQYGILAGLQSVSLIFQQPDFWLWFYLVVVVSSMMLPSKTDRRSWLIIGLWIGIIIIISMVAGAGSWLVDYFAPWIKKIITSLTIIFGISALVHFFLLPVFWFLHFITSRLTGC